MHPGLLNIERETWRSNFSTSEGCVMQSMNHADQDKRCGRITLSLSATGLCQYRLLPSASLGVEEAVPSRNQHAGSCFQQ